MESTNRRKIVKQVSSTRIFRNEALFGLVELGTNLVESESGVDKGGDDGEREDGVREDVEKDQDYEAEEHRL